MYLIVTQLRLTNPMFFFSFLSSFRRLTTKILFVKTDHTVSKTMSIYQTVEMADYGETGLSTICIKGK